MALRDASARTGLYTGTLAAELLDVEAIDDNALVPGPLHEPGHLHRTLVINQGADEVQSCVYTSTVAPSCHDTKSSEAHSSATDDGFASIVGALEGHASLAAKLLISSP